MTDQRDTEPLLATGESAAQAEAVHPEAASPEGACVEAVQAEAIRTEEDELFAARVEVAAKPAEPMVTEIRVQLTKEPPILAFVAITLWDVFVVHDLRVLQRHDSSRVVLMPRLQGPDGNWSTVAHPIREPARLKIEAAVLRAFEEEVARSSVLEASG